MKISYNWLQKYFDEKLPDPEALASGIIFHSFEVEEIEKVGSDTVFEIKILPDRAHDCLCHFGIAKEVSAVFDIKIKSVLEIVGMPEQDSGDNLQIQVSSDKCPRYMGRIVKGVKVGPSPAWLADALISIGQKSINNVVDATNYVMFDLGNPIHAFDLDKLASNKIIIEPAKNGEKFTLLDGREVTLDDSMLTIRDEVDALVIAGVKGGKKAEIDNNTKNIMIEVANFEPISTRKTAKKLGIFTDSAKRFENEIPAALVPFAMDKITEMIVKVAGGEVLSIVDIYTNNEIDKKVSFTESYLEKMLGTEIQKETICNILERFNYKYTNDAGVFQVEIPFLRLDLNEPHDMVEEIGRIYGYDKVTPVLPKIDFEIKENKMWLSMSKARLYLLSQGYKEVMTYSFCDKGDVEILASASDKNFLRNNITDGLKESIRMNNLNLPLLDMKEVKVFEIGMVFHKDGEIMSVAYGDKKNVVEMSLEEFVVSSGKLFVRSSDEGDGSQRQTIPNSSPDSTTHKNSFKMWSLYPFISRDIAVWLPEGTDKEKLKNILVENAGDLLVKEPYLFDSFTKPASTQGGGERTSFGYRLVFQSYEKTLTDEEINPIMEKINQKISNEGWEVR